MSIQSEIDRLQATKASIKNAIISKGQPVADTDTFASYAEKIAAINTLAAGTADATAAAGDILNGKTAYVKGAKVTGNIPSQGAKTITPGATDQTAVASGVFTTGAVTVKGDANLKAENIAEGVSIFGVVGTFAGGGKKTVTVTIINESIDYCYYWTEDGTMHRVNAKTTETVEAFGGAVYRDGQASLGEYSDIIIAINEHAGKGFYLAKRDGARLQLVYSSGGTDD